jgi:hypothetical protein
LCVPDLDPPQQASADLILYSTGYAKIVELNFGGYAFLKEHLSYRPEGLPFNPHALDEVEQGYKRAVQDQVPYVYMDSDWLETEAGLPAWDDYRRQIEEGLKASLKHRDTINEIYASRLPPEVQLPQGYQTWRFNLRIKNKAQVLEGIFASGAFASSHYASLAGIMAPGQCPQAEMLAKEIINLFNDRHFDPPIAESVCAVILEKLT